MVPGAFSEPMKSSSIGCGPGRRPPGAASPAPRPHLNPRPPWWESRGRHAKPVRSSSHQPQLLCHPFFSTKPPCRRPQRRAMALWPYRPGDWKGKSTKNRRIGAPFKAEAHSYSHPLWPCWHPSASNIAGLLRYWQPPSPIPWTRACPSGWSNTAPAAVSSHTCCNLRLKNHTQNEAAATSMQQTTFLNRSILSTTVFLPIFAFQRGWRGGGVTREKHPTIHHTATEVTWAADQDTRLAAEAGHLR